MTNSNYEKEIDREKLDIETYGNSLFKTDQTDVMTGDNNKSRYLYYQLKDSIEKADQIDIVVSFLMESGVRMILEDLREALNRGVKIRLLTGNYLGITQPSALYLIKYELGDKIDLRFYDEKNRSFHPKAYIFHYNMKSEIYVGSSNISKSALTSGIEWNYRFDNLRDKKNYNLFYETFKDLFTRHSLVIDDKILATYSKNWRRPAVSKDLENYDDQSIEEDETFNSNLRSADYDADTSYWVDGITNNVEPLFQPRGAQIEALYALKNSREEGANKGLIYAATGVGKTYLAAFDSKKFNRVLFVAHREEILKQAAESFYNIRNSDDFGFFNGNEKETDKSVIFASVASLGKTKYLNEKYFKEDYFDYIVIDEFHHAVNDAYLRIINYFKPKFLLGLTATPERMDGRNIYKLCDYIVPYKISLKDAINKGMLVPFHYYGIYDETVDYGDICIVKGKYEQKALNEKLMINSRYELIFKYYTKYNSNCALGFCCSIKHAENMAREFCNKGIPSVAVHSGAMSKYSDDRKSAINRLKMGEIKVIFSVDMFNEGLDIPAIDMVMFLRPTESSVVFLQQTGRGLRKCKGKDYLNILDFIGNYKKAGNAPFLLSEEPYSKTVAAKKATKDFEFPDDCIVDFDMKLVDLFKKMAVQDLTKKEFIRTEYYRVKEILDDKVPSRMDLFTYMSDEIYTLCLKNSKLSPFKNYLAFLSELNELNSDEEILYNNIGHNFINLIETTSMTKSYKIPILNAFYNNGKIKMAITDEDVYKSMKSFYNNGLNGKDLMSAKETMNYKDWNKKKFIAKANEQPIKFLKKSGNGFFIDKKEYELALNEQLSEIISNGSFVKHMKDSIEYRTMDYYKRRFEE